MSRSPTFDDTYNDLIAVCKAAQKGLYDLGRCREAYADEELTTLVLGVSKAILNRLPCLQLQNDAIEEMDSTFDLLRQLAYFQNLIFHFLLHSLFQTTGNISEISGREAISETMLPMGNFSSTRISLFDSSFSSSTRISLFLASADSEVRSYSVGACCNTLGWPDRLPSWDYLRITQVSLKYQEVSLGKS